MKLRRLLVCCILSLFLSLNKLVFAYNNIDIHQTSPARFNEPSLQQDAITQLWADQLKNASTPDQALSLLTQTMASGPNSITTPGYDWINGFADMLGSIGAGQKGGDLARGIVLAYILTQSPNGPYGELMLSTHFMDPEPLGLALGALANAGMLDGIRTICTSVFITPSLTGQALASLARNADAGGAPTAAAVVNALPIPTASVALGSLFTADGGADQSLGSILGNLDTNQAYNLLFYKPTSNALGIPLSFDPGRAVDKMDGPAAAKLVEMIIDKQDRHMISDILSKVNTTLKGDILQWVCDNDPAHLQKVLQAGGGNADVLWSGALQSLLDKGDLKTAITVGNMMSNDAISFMLFELGRDPKGVSEGNRFLSQIDPRKAAQVLGQLLSYGLGYANVARFLSSMPPEKSTAILSKMNPGNIKDKLMDAMAFAGTSKTVEKNTDNNDPVGIEASFQMTQHNDYPNGGLDPLHHSFPPHSSAQDLR